MSAGQRTDSPGHRPGLAAGLVRGLLALACMTYAAAALAGRGAWLPAVAAAIVAVLLWRRHPRARFAAYIFLSALALRAALTAAWPTLAFAVMAVIVLQTPPATAVWPRLARDRIRGDRMPAP